MLRGLGRDTLESFVDFVFSVCGENSYTAEARRRMSAMPL